MQFIGGKKKLVFDFVNPLEAENPTHEVEGGGTLMHGKYWKRRMETVLAEYKNWRIYYKSHRPPTCPHVKKPTQVQQPFLVWSLTQKNGLLTWRSSGLSQ